jgi:chlorophyll(ide) b reductase
VQISAFFDFRAAQYCGLLSQVVVTGSTKGLGFAIADKFLALGDDVMLSSRSLLSCQEAAKALQGKYPTRTVTYRTCDVRSHSDVDALADAAASELGRIDIWVNNAGASQTPSSPLHETDGDTLDQIVGTNLLGTVYGCRSAIRVMHGQHTGGKVGHTSVQCTHSICSTLRSVLLSFKAQMGDFSIRVLV